MKKGSKGSKGSRKKTQQIATRATTDILVNNNQQPTTTAKDLMGQQLKTIKNYYKGLGWSTTTNNIHQLQWIKLVQNYPNDPKIIKE